MNPTALIINPRVRLILVLAAAAGCEAGALAADGPTAAPGQGDVMSRYVRVSPRDSRYLELSDGTPYIPNGLNVIHPQGGVSTEEGLAQMERWMKSLADNEGILAEGGAVEPRHTGPFKLYAKDQAGIILHDVIFAPFFAGAAGAGQCWHWSEYVDKNSLWHQFRAFADTVRGLDPPAEAFEPLMIRHPRLRVYVLKGRRTSLLWCRDTENTWQTELEQGLAPEELRDVVVPWKDGGPLARRTARAYDPWKKVWTDARIEDDGVRLPAFARSIVVRLGPG
jgi:hypothetical protein